MDETTNEPILPDKTWLAAILAIVLVIPVMFLAGIAVVIYADLLKDYLFGIPYVETIALIWFPEILRGALTGVLVIGITHSIIKRCRINVVRYSVLVFWGIMMAAIAVINIKGHGITRDNISILINLIGLPIGLWMTSETETPLN